MQSLPRTTHILLGMSRMPVTCLLASLVDIDTVCINQKDEDEKTNQVEVMDQIYQSAEEALVWLGSRAEGSETSSEAACSKEGQNHRIQ